MTDIVALMADNFAIWTAAVERRLGVGRGGGKRVSLYGIERLRTLILDLAVRGKLLPQDSRDEHSALLLKRIRAQQAATPKARQVASSALEFPFEAPPNWTWVQVGEIGHDWGQQEPSSTFTYVDVGSIDQSKGIIRSPTILEAKDAPSRARKNVRVGTVIYSTVRPYLLNIAIVDKKFCPPPVASTAFAIVHPYDGVEARFVYHYLRSPSFIAYVEGCQTGIAYPAINDRQFFSAWFPLPPLAEQKRIVLKVDELIALCDSLEQESASAMGAHQCLVETLISTLVDSPNASTLATNWSRLKSKFDTLFNHRSQRRNFEANHFRTRSSWQAGEAGPE